MPIYEYGCSGCGHVMELLMRVSDPAPEACEKCGSPVAKKISQTTFALKGSGWYVTDYKAGAKATASAEAENSGKTEAPVTEVKKDDPASPAASTSTSPSKPAPTTPTPTAGASSSGTSGNGGSGSVKT